MGKITTDKDTEQKYNLRITAIICSTILGIMSLIGLFWGKAGLEVFGALILILMMGAIMYMANAQ